MYKVSEVSKLTGVSVRMLHHYDKIGLLVPFEKSDCKYRFYSNDDIARLYQILIFKELDFSLSNIKKILDDTNFDRKEALIEQRKMIESQKKRLENILDSIDDTLVNLRGDGIMSNKSFRAFSYEEVKKHEEKYADETKHKYGDSDAYKESKAKTDKYTKSDWDRVMSDADSLYIKLSELMDRDVSDSEVQKIVEDWRNYISENFYNCTIEIFRGLALIYVADDRFTKNIDKYGEGLAQFLSDAMTVYCDNNK